MDGKGAPFKVKSGKRELKSDQLKSESMENDDGYGSWWISVNLTGIDSSAPGDGRSQGMLECKHGSTRLSPHGKRMARQIGQPSQAALPVITNQTGQIMSLEKFRSGESDLHSRLGCPCSRSELRRAAADDRCPPHGHIGQPVEWIRNI